MKNQLEHIRGVEIKALPISFEWVGDFLFFEWSLVSVLRGEDNGPYLKIWLENQEDITRYAILKIESSALSNYIHGKVTYLEILLNPVNELMFIVDQISDDTIKSVKVIAVQSFPKAYHPKEGILFDQSEAINLDQISKIFNLSSKGKSTQFDMLEEAQINDSELVNLHLSAQNEKVGYGRIQSRVLGEALVNYSKISEATIINLVERQKIAAGHSSRWKKGELDNVKKLAVTEYSYAKAASFSVFLKPIKIIDNFANGKTSTENIANEIFELFKAGKDIKALNKGHFSSAMITAFSAFLRSVKENELNLTVQYGNPDKSYAIREFFNPQTSEIIIKNLSELEQSKPENFNVTGKFTALDRVKNKFIFWSDDQEIFEGKFNNDLFELIGRFSLEKAYDVLIEEVLEKKNGRSVAIHRYTVISCYESK